MADTLSVSSILYFYNCQQCRFKFKKNNNKIIFICTVFHASVLGNIYIQGKIQIAFRIDRKEYKFSLITRLYLVDVYLLHQYHNTMLIPMIHYETYMYILHVLHKCYLRNTLITMRRTKSM